MIRSSAVAVLLSVSMLSVWASAAAPPMVDPKEGTSTDFDVVVYGGTSAGVAAAVQAARMGKTAALVEPGKHLGGLTSGGLTSRAGSAPPRRLNYPVPRSALCVQPNLGKHGVPCPTQRHQFRKTHRSRCEPPSKAG